MFYLSLSVHVQRHFYALFSFCSLLCPRDVYHFLLRYVQPQSAVYIITSVGKLSLVCSNCWTVSLISSIGQLFWTCRCLPNDRIDPHQPYPSCSPRSPLHNWCSCFCFVFTAVCSYRICSFDLVARLRALTPSALKLVRTHTCQCLYRHFLLFAVRIVHTLCPTA
ncbi:hypothetical protein AHF37_03317 [Paragonimus kellicotti]|nr:hypothetical protein AHF37_03317 [Paragonimus kellicotti]